MNDRSRHPSDFDLERLRKDDCIGEFVFVESTGSTNDLARKLGQEPSIQLPALILTANQTAGRGRGDHRWDSSDGALTFSYVIEIPQSHENARRAGLSLVAALSVVEAVVDLTELQSASIKWPNDVLVAEKKVAGILIEQVPGNAHRLVFGIGINVNNQLDQARLPFATSLATEIGRSIDRTELLLKTLRRLERNSKEWITGNSKIIKSCNQVLAFREQDVELQTSDTVVNGICEGLDEFGQIVIADNAGRKSMYASGTLRTTKR